MDTSTPALSSALRALASVGLALSVGCGAGESERAADARAPAASPSPQPSDPAEDAATRVHAWECEDGIYVVTELRQEPDEIFVFLPDDNLTLPHVPAASGAKYSDGSSTLWTKDREMSLELAGRQSLRCRLDLRRSQIESSKLAGYDFWAIGNEPGWVLQVGAGRLVWVTDYGQTQIIAEPGEPEIDAEARRTVFTASADGLDLSVTLIGEPCADDMSGEAFETQVVIVHGERTYRGCGQALQ